jgi:F0F1-type ATP synthase assembly protein I
MANDSGGNSFLSFVLGGLVVVLAILVFAIFGGHAGGDKSSTVKLELPTAAAPK